MADQDTSRPHVVTGPEGKRTHNLGEVRFDMSNTKPSTARKEGDSNV